MASSLLRGERFYLICDGVDGKFQVFTVVKQTQTLSNSRFRAGAAMQKSLS